MSQSLNLGRLDVPGGDGGFVGIGFGTGLGLLASFLGARQVETYQFSMGDISGLGFLFWMLVFAVMCLQGRTFMRRHGFEISAIVFYLSTYFLIEVTARIFESMLLPVLLAGLHMTNWRRMTFNSLIIFFGVLTYLLRIGKPWLGFGI